MAEDTGGPIGDLGGPDLSAIGNAARASKSASAAPQSLTSFSVKKGDNGGVTVCESYERKAPEGRRATSFLGGGDYKENPFGPDDGGQAVRHITGLLGQMGLQGAVARPPAPTPRPPAPMRPPVPPPAAPRPPAAAIARGPNAAAVRGPAGGGALFGAGPGTGY